MKWVREIMRFLDQLVQGSGVLHYIAYTIYVHANMCERVIA